MIRVLIVDDSPTIRELYRRTLARESDIEVVGEAPDPYTARDLIAQLRPDVLTLDVEMPRMDGLTFLERVMQHYPLPVVMVSSLTERGSELAMRAFDIGAVEVLCKPLVREELERLGHDLVRAVRGAAAARLRRPAAPRVERPRATLAAPAPDAVVAIGASTGGPAAIEEVLRELPEACPPVFITQHMPAGFTRAFAARLDRVSALDVWEARDGDEVPPGSAVIAPGGEHLLARRVGHRFYAEVRRGPRVSGHCPSVDVLFRSLARAARGAVGVLLTGMGEDGARGLLALREAGAATLVQDEPTSVVFGMPRVALELGASGEAVPLERVVSRILHHLRHLTQGPAETLNARNA